MNANGSWLTEYFGAPNKPGHDVAGYSDVFDVGAAGERVAEEVWADVGAAINNPFAPLMAANAAAAAAAQKAREVAAGRGAAAQAQVMSVAMRSLMQKQAQAAQERAMMSQASAKAQVETKVAANQLLALQSAAINAGDTADFVVEFQSTWWWVYLSLTEATANTFVMTDLDIAGVPWLGLGVRVTSGNVSAPGLSLAPFTPGYTGISPVPFLGRKYEGSGEITFTVKNIGASAATFVATLGYNCDVAKLLGACGR
jgi:hypothetical protein